MDSVKFPTVDSMEWRLAELGLLVIALILNFTARGVWVDVFFSCAITLVFTARYARWSWRRSGQGQ